MPAKPYSFIVVIPVADRPQHLAQCLDSLYTLCEHFPYVGKISVLVADDSVQADSIVQNKHIASGAGHEDVPIEYFGLLEQSKLNQALTPIQQKNLQGVIGSYSGTVTGHKGASRIRNLAYIKLREMVRGSEKNTLIHFIDSDQEFRVCVLEDGVRKERVVINYYQQLNKIFTRQDVNVLTGKVVGDPPVSPAVMAGNFVQDVTAFLQQISSHVPSVPCQFHHHQQSQNVDAAYHDMAQLFGFDNNPDREPYACTLPDSHDHQCCFEEFCSRLGHFFYGEHPTRPSYFYPTDDLSHTEPARTVYTGNYVLRAAMLRYFNPFATLNLRMIGPALGRIIRKEIGGQFVAANLPMLHKRTVADSGVSEFRPGVEQAGQLIELAGEFERQFYGDILLFSVEVLTAHSPLLEKMDTKKVAKVVSDTAKEMRVQYSRQHGLINTALKNLNTVFSNQQHWWNQHHSSAVPRKQLANFIATIEHNFGDQSKGWRLVMNESVQQEMLDKIVVAITDYPRDREYWQAFMDA